MISRRNGLSNFRPSLLRPRRFFSRDVIFLHLHVSVVIYVIDYEEDNEYFWDPMFIGPAVLFTERRQDVCVAKVILWILTSCTYWWENRDTPPPIYWLSWSHLLSASFWLLPQNFARWLGPMSECYTPGTRVFY